MASEDCEALKQAERERDAHKAEARVHWLALVEARGEAAAYQALGDPQWIRDALAERDAARAEVERLKETYAIQHAFMLELEQQLAVETALRVQVSEDSQRHIAALARVRAQLKACEERNQTALEGR